MTGKTVICDAPFIVTTPRFLERGVRDGQKKDRRNRRFVKAVPA